MKFKFILITILPFLLFSCTTMKSQNNIDILFKRWKIDHVEMGGQKIDQIAGEKITEEGEFEYEFRKDNSYSVFSLGKIESNGTWEWNNDENCIYLRNEYDEINGKVVSIEKNSIILIPTSEIGKYPHLEIVKYYYVPK
ncbi:hypothetical protein [Chryseobacterium sp. MFBS3-17]|uniref:hypothetical protein n=1 Tax=Chryseobacterium sp. MFBS3-17 TaxID=2886689 RepID=UPI001D0E6921|nr:hypothetical protein [Chryseobacterium sp. MFBS3-17]MCC2590920.1 hypothetical protein [Chryseobacterium sp. MFBS3-17]